MANANENKTYLDDIGIFDMYIFNFNDFKMVTIKKPFADSIEFKIATYPYILRNHGLNVEGLFLIRPAKIFEFYNLVKKFDRKIKVIYRSKKYEDRLPTMETLQRTVEDMLETTKEKTAFVHAINDSWILDDDNSLLNMKIMFKMPQAAYLDNSTFKCGTKFRGWGFRDVDLDILFGILDEIDYDGVFLVKK